MLHYLGHKYYLLPNQVIVEYISLVYNFIFQKFIGISFKNFA